MFSELTISWRSDAGLHTLLLDDDGVHIVPPLPTSKAIPVTRPARGPARRGKLWSADEETTLRAGFDEGRAAADIAAELGRSPGAVNARLVAMGLLDPEVAGLRYPVRSGEGAATPQ